MNDYQFVDGTRLVSVVEALIFASPDPLSWDHLAGIIRESEEEIDLSREAVTGIVDQLNSRYEENDLSFRIEEMGKGFTFVTRPRYHPWLSIFQHQNAYRKLSQSATETLAIVAYRQPITKPEVDQIRGVDSGYILRQLLEKMLVKVSGRADSPGKPLLYKTTDQFLKHFGINSVDELPRPREIEEILKDDDMAEHRRVLMERQLQFEGLDSESDDEPGADEDGEGLQVEGQEEEISGDEGSESIGMEGAGPESGNPEDAAPEDDDEPEKEP